MLAGVQRPGSGYYPSGKPSGGGSGPNRWSTWDPSVGILGGSRPLAIGHRGSCGQLPDHTLASYARAIEQVGDCDTVHG
jgi:glycerophosphoryl diester phosphodiesterase